MNNVFRFKQFNVSQNHAGLKVNTDAVLLGAYTDVYNHNKILDIGTGTGVIALMLAQRSNAEIDAIDINEEAGKDAQINFRNSPWAASLKFHLVSIQEYSRKTKERYDLIVCNPPFFQNSVPSENQAKSIAKHNINLQIDELFEAAKKLLTPNGKLSVIFPSDISNQVKEVAGKLDFHINHSLLIKPTPQKPPKRIICEFGFTSEKKKQETIIIEDRGRHKYSEKYKTLLKDYLIIF